MNKIVLVGFGGFVGAVFRYAVSGWVQRWSKNVTFPYGTLAVNLLGCLLIGILSQLAEDRSIFNSEMRLFIFIGLLGAFTTFSTFSSDTINTLRDGENFLAFVNVAVQLIGGLSLVWIGRTVTHLLMEVVR